jgi:hypothetical protein
MKTINYSDCNGIVKVNCRVSKHDEVDYHDCFELCRDHGWTVWAKNVWEKEYIKSRMAHVRRDWNENVFEIRKEVNNVIVVLSIAFLDNETDEDIINRELGQAGLDAYVEYIDSCKRQGETPISATDYIQDKQNRSAAAATLGKLGGKSKSKAKQASSANNGKKGGRPKMVYKIKINKGIEKSYIVSGRLNNQIKTDENGERYFIGLNGSSYPYNDDNDILFADHFISKKKTEDKLAKIYFPDSQERYDLRKSTNIKINDKATTEQLKKIKQAINNNQFILYFKKIETLKKDEASCIIKWIKDKK